MNGSLKNIKWLILVFASLVCISNVFAQIIEEVPEEIILEEEYEEISDISVRNPEWPLTFDTIRFKKHGKYGFVHNQNEILIPFEYDGLSPKYTDLMIAKKGENSGVIDKNNNIIIPFEYSFIFINDNGIVVENKSGKEGIMDFSGNIIIPIVFDHAYARPGFKAIKFDNVEAIFYTISKDVEKSTFYSKQGEVLYVADYSYFESISDDYYKVKKNGKFGLLDRNKSITLDCLYGNFTWIKDSITCTSINNKAALINLNNELIVHDTYKFYSRPDSFGNMIVFNKNSSFIKGVKQSIFNLDKRLIYGPTELNIKYVNPKLYAIKNHSKVSDLVDENGNSVTLLEEIPSEVRVLNQDYFAIKTSKETWAVLRSDQTLVTEEQFLLVREFNRIRKNSDPISETDAAIAMVYAYNQKKEVITYYLFPDGKKIEK